MIIGIDPGNDGGIVFLRTDGNIDREKMFVMPKVLCGKQSGKSKKFEVDPAGVAQVLSANIFSPASTTVFLEKVHSMPKQGISSAFKFGCGYGAVRGVLAALKIRTVLVTPQAWQKHVMAGHAKGAENTVASQLYPTIDFRDPASPRARLPHSGLVDAALIARYGYVMDPKPEEENIPF